MFSFLRALFAVKRTRSLFERGYYANFASRGSLPEIVEWEGMEVLRDIPYSDDVHDRHRKLDIYKPGSTAQKLPVILFVHGGGWRTADKADPIYVHQNFCHHIAKQGFIVVSANHRLSPAVKHPVHSHDIARALRWVCSEIIHFGGDPLKLFLSGHSSGAHITAYLFTHPGILEENHVPATSVKGFIGISGVYDLFLFGHALFPREFMAIPAFGKDPSNWKEASPVNSGHIIPSPMLLLNAEHDMGLEHQSKEMLRKFPDDRNERVIVPGCNHFTIVTKVNPPGSVVELIARFARENA